MSPDVHAARAERIAASIGRCETGDYEVVIEGAMLAGADWLNAALHAAGLAPPERDAMHSEFLTLGERRRIAVVLPSLVECLDEIEEMRAPYSRGAEAGGPEAGLRAIALLDRIRAIARDAMSAE